MTKASAPVDPADPRVASGEIWEAFCAALRRAGGLVTGDGVPDSPRDRAEGFRYLTRFLAAGIAVCVEHADPDHPEFARMIEHATKWGLDAPDCLYLHAAIRGDAAYRIFGERGSANHLDVQVNFGHFASGDIAAWGTLDSLSGLELESVADGSFELFLGGEPRPRNWLRLAPEAGFVLVRQYFADWERESPAEIFIERVGAELPPPPLGSAALAARLERLIQWVERGGTLWDRMSRGLLSMQPNSLIVHRPEGAGERAGLAGQAYGMGNFQCAPDEAVIVEFEPPPCRHWSVALASFFWESLDYASRQGSLNGHQARLDADGVFRGVIAHRDPGVPNWLDASGHTKGTLAVRFLLAESVPGIRLRALPADALASALPPDTPRVTPAERAATLRRRQRAIWRRDRR